MAAIFVVVVVVIVVTIAFVSGEGFPPAAWEVCGRKVKWGKSFIYTKCDILLIISMSNSICIASNNAILCGYMVYSTLLAC